MPVRWGDVADAVCEIRGGANCADAVCKICSVGHQQLQDALALKNAEHFRKAYLLSAMPVGMVEMNLPDMPRSSKQRYRLTAKASQWLAKKRKGN